MAYWPFLDRSGFSPNGTLLFNIPRFSSVLRYFPIELRSIPARSAISFGAVAPLPTASSTEL